jgi:hypothetical protein
VPRAPVKLTFSDGSAITSFLSLQHTEQFSQPVDEMRFTCAPPRSEVQTYASKLKKGEIVGLIVNNKPQAACMLTTIETEIGPGGIVFSCTAKSPLAILQESTVSFETESKALAADKPILQFVADLIEPFGLGEVYATDDIAVIKTRTGKPTKAQATPASNVKYKVAVAQPNETVYQFINRILARLGLILRCDAVFGGLYLTRPHYDQDSLYAFKVGPEGPSSQSVHVFEGTVRIVDTNDGQYSFCEAYGVADDSAAATESGRPRSKIYSAALNSKRPPFRASEFITHKPCFYKDTSCHSAKHAKSVALLVLGERAESAFYVEGSVDNIVSNEGVPFCVDTMARIYIPHVNLDEVMWLSQRTISVDAQGGGRTQLRFIPSGFYTIGELPS